MEALGIFLAAGVGVEWRAWKDTDRAFSSEGVFLGVFFVDLYTDVLRVGVLGAELCKRWKEER